jgi:hypothetical protein
VFYVDHGNASSFVHLLPQHSSSVGAEQQGVQGLQPQPRRSSGGDTTAVHPPKRQQMGGAANRSNAGE